MPLRTFARTLKTFAPTLKTFAQTLKDVRWTLKTFAPTLKTFAKTLKTFAPGTPREGSGRFSPKSGTKAPHLRGLVTDGAEVGIMEFWKATAQRWWRSRTLESRYAVFDPFPIVPITTIGSSFRTKQNSFSKLACTYSQTTLRRCSRAR